MAIRGIILDLDGTLVDTNPAHVEAWRRAFASHGYDIPADRIAKEIGKGGDQLIPSIIGREAADRDGKAISEAHGEEFLAIARREHFRLLPGAVELVEGLKARKLPTALATSSKEKFLKAVADSCGVDFTKRVDVLVNADEADASKPAPDLVTAAVDKLGQPAAACVMIGDSPYDAEACGRAGVRCWGLLCGGFPEEALRTAGAVGVWHDPADLLAHLDELLAAG